MTATLTRQHFEALAFAIKGMELHNDQKLVLSQRIADVLTPFNDAFQRDLFVKVSMGWKKI